MKNRFVVTITDINGSKQYNVHQYMKQIVLYVILLVVVIFFFSFISIQLLLKEVQQIEVKRDLMQQEYLKNNEKNETLLTRIKKITKPVLNITFAQVKFLIFCIFMIYFQMAEMILKKVI